MPPGPGRPRSGMHDELARSPTRQEGLLSAAQTRVGATSRNGSGAGCLAGWLDRVAPARLRRPRRPRDAPVPAAARVAEPRRTELGELRGRGDAARPRPLAIPTPSSSPSTATDATVSTCPFTVHTTDMLKPIDFVEVDGFRAMSATRTIIDLAHARAHTARVEAAIDSAVRLGLSSPEVLADRLETLRGSGRWGCRLVEELIVDSGGHTMLERRFLATRPAGWTPAAAHAGGASQERTPHRPRRLPVRRGGRGGGGVRPARPLDVRPSALGTPSGATSCRTSAGGCTSTRGRTSPSDRYSSPARSSNASGSRA